MKLGTFFSFGATVYAAGKIFEFNTEYDPYIWPLRALIDSIHLKNEL